MHALLTFPIIILLKLYHIVVTAYVPLYYAMLADSLSRTTDTVLTLSLPAASASRVNETVVHTLGTTTNNGLETLETLFAGLSVLIGTLALVVGLFQLSRYRKRRTSSAMVDVFELEAGLPQVMYNPDSHSGIPNRDVDLDWR